MSQVSTPSVPERVVDGSNAARRSQQAGSLALSQRNGIHVTATLAASVGVTQAVASTDPEPEVSPLQLAPTTRPPVIPDLYIDTLVAFSPAKEGWMPRKTHKYVGVGNAYLVGRVCRIMKRTLFQIQWLDPQYQNHVESLNLRMIQRGNGNCRSLHAIEECMEKFNSPTDLPTSLAEVEAINSMHFDPTIHCGEPADLFQHADGSTTTWLRPTLCIGQFFCVHLGFVPAAVVGETNSYARVYGIKLKTCFSLEEIMKFIGVLLYMSLVNKGEYNNYWGQQVEDAIFGGNTVNLDSVMPLQRFKKLRQAFSFQCVEDNATNTDQAARIRPLLILLKSIGSKYVEVGWNVALDEASIACRSNYGKPLIVYNPMKPGGKYPFRIYMLCCSTTWISLNFRLHCQRDISDRQHGVTTPVEAQALSDKLASSSSIRKCVLEVVQPLYGTRRIINSDNYYTSVKLLDPLRLKGLYARGTVRKTSAHFPRYVVLEKKDGPRGTSGQGVSVDRSTVAASWFYSSIVTVVSNADASSQSSVTRQVRSEKVTFNAPTCIREFDRLDQTRCLMDIRSKSGTKSWVLPLLTWRGLMHTLHASWHSTVAMIATLTRLLSVNLVLS
ncbi:unnamed protein product [Phytophthora fragariaefolia]|uniref:Unnamed protein product n=1 Tax=Phytophthora fragariaefolia TaxID=1490495 RepID=A0A9W6U0A1_9STRA|nr:unnamed protein product [Phytophthora fragariaefolia]